MASSRWRPRLLRRLRRSPARPKPAVVASRGWEHVTYRGAAGTRTYAVYTPPRLNPRRPVPVWVMLHGCSQDAADIATGTRLDALADQAGFLAVYPEQNSEHNPRACWNWFDPRHQVRGSGEPAIIAGIIREVLDGRPLADPDRVYLTGLSAGGAMAGVLAATYPDLIAAVGIHSGSQYAAARNTPSAVLAMATGGPDPEGQGRLAHAAMGERSRVMPVVVIQGDRDRTVRERSGENAVRQWLATNRLAGGHGTGWDFTAPDARRLEQPPGGLSTTVRSWVDPSGRSVLEYWLVIGLGHAWSGGAPAGSFTDPRGPDATAVMHRFLSQHRLRRVPARPGAAVVLRVPAVVARRLPAVLARRLVTRSALLTRILRALRHPVQTFRSVRRAVQLARRPRRPLRIRR